jgi:type IV secretion system protein VirB5
MDHPEDRRGRAATRLRRIGLLSACCLTLLPPPPVAHAQLAVIDVASLSQLLAQAQTLMQQLQAARTRIIQAETLYQSMTGKRGMQQLLNNAALNYLPVSWMQLNGVMQGNAGAYPALAAGVSGAIASNAVLTPAQLAVLSADEQTSITAGRQSLALRQGLVEQALSNSSGRFADIEQLVRAIPTALDQKGILELQAAIASELAVLQNEQTKLQVLYQAAASDEQANSQQVRELIIAGHGNFAARFEPAPPQ